jgi:hypothetical protein
VTTQLMYDLRGSRLARSVTPPITYKSGTVRFVGPPAGLGPLESPCTNLVWFDLDQERGFQGFCLQDVTIVQPKNTPPGGELTPPEQGTNRRISSVRIRMEHAMGGVKRDRSVKGNIRLLTDGRRDAVMATGCG